MIEIFKNRFFPLRIAVCFLIEGGIILFSVFASFSLLYRDAGIGLGSGHDALTRGLLFAFLCQSCMYFLDMYDLKNSQSLREIFFSLVFAIGVVCVGIGMISFLLPDFAVEGKVYYLTIVFVAFLLLFWRILFDYYLTHLGPRQNILIMGNGAVARLVAKEIRDREKYGFHLVGFTGKNPAPGDWNGGLGAILGSDDDIGVIAAEHRVRKVVVAVDERRGGYPVDALLAIRVGGGQVVEWPEFFEKLSGRIAIDNLSPSYFIFTEGFRKSKLALAASRASSVIVAVLSILVLFPVLLLCAALIKLDSRGPVFYTQERIGKNGKRFTIYKFRSMQQDAENGTGARWATRDDPRVTRVGRILRLSRIDEIPQIFNVLKGDINLVGPRPERPEFVAHLRKLIPYYDLRHTVKPGLTGWAQVMFPYCGTILESKEKLQYDLFYLKNMTFKLDMLILFKTIKIVILGRGAR